MRVGDAAQVVVGCLAFAAVFGFVTHYIEFLGAWDRWTPRLRRRRRDAPTGRPIEDVALDVRRLGRRFRCPVPGTRYVKIEGLRRAYDGALAEACTAVGVDHLLAVLPPGPELDHERERVEVALSAAGLVLDPAGTSGL